MGFMVFILFAVLLGSTACFPKSAQGLHDGQDFLRSSDQFNKSANVVAHTDGALEMVPNGHRGPEWAIALWNPCSPTMMARQKIGSRQRDFYVHALYMDDKKNKKIKKEDEVVFPYIQEVTNYLTTWWKTFDGTNNNGAFWRQEYERHNSGYTPEQYAIKVMTARGNAIRSLRWVREAFQDPLQSFGFGNAPVASWTCEKSKKQHKKQILVQVKLCLDEQLNVIDCNTATFNGCKENLPVYLRDDERRRDDVSGITSLQA
uniref:Secreted protein n=1 Tax=Steinernema glaseri TaxID=37863 RepID=A0A1I8AGR8_9BILA